jgi:L-seryl-tRNA(Ser) seleniumtransferase
VLAVEVRQANAFLSKLRQNSPPVIARINEHRVLFDPRTLFENEEESFLNCLQKNYPGRAHES